MTSKFRTVLYCLLLISWSFVNAQKTYRIKHVKNTGSLVDKYVEFILPPNAKIAREGLFNNRRNLDFKLDSRYRHQYIIIQNLTNDYFSCLKQIENAIYVRRKDPDPVFLKENYGIENHPKAIGARQFASYYSSSDNTGYKSGDKINLAIELDLDKLLNNESSYVTNYRQLSTDLLIALSQFESNTSLPPSVAQSITEKTWGIAPVPQATALSGDLLTISDTKSVVLLNAKMSLQIDHSLFYSDPNGQNEFDGFNYYLAGQTVLSFFRDRDGLLKQSSFLLLEKNTTPNFLPNNSIVSATDRVSHIQASSVDIQLSDMTNKKRFFGLYQNFLKRNNNQSSKGVNKDNLDDDLYRGNSIMLFSDDAQNIINYPNGDASNTVKSTFCNGKLIYSAMTISPGCRCVITPLLSVFIDETAHAVPLGMTVGEFLQMKSIPVNQVHLYRIHNGKLRVVNDFNYATILSLGDKFLIK